MSEETTREQNNLFEIEEIEFVPYDKTMIDIEVEDDHTFYVAQDAESDFVLTHNTNWPDIDSDAGDRDALINAARELYGFESVIPVSNFNTLKLKSLVKDIAKFYQIDFAEVNKMTGPLQDEVMAQARDENTEKSLFILKHEDCMQYSKGYRAFMEKYPKVKDHIEALFMQNRSIGRHAGGVIIGPSEELEKTMPIIGVRGELQTPWTEGMNFRNLEENGFIKFDFLGLTLLKDVENCIRRILTKETGKEPTFIEIRDWFDEKLNCRFVEQDDPKVWEHVYHQRRKVGVFQFTAEGARRFCEDAKPTSIVELAALTAIYRPGPLRANVHKKYVKDKAHADQIEYAHPIIKEILGPTFGHVTFQEQFMLLAQKLGGFTPAESDKLRKTLVKKSLDTMGKKGGEREEARVKFITGAKEINGVPEHVSQELWERIEFFSVYGFNKSVTHDTMIDIYNKHGEFMHTEQIQNVIPGSYVRSRDEETKEEIFTKVTSNHYHGKVPTFEITLDTGEAVTCTMHHKFRVEDGRMLPLWLILQEDLSIVSVGECMKEEAA